MRNDRHPYSLIGIDGNAFSVMGYTMKAMKQCGYSNDAIQCYREDAMSGDYDNLLALSCMMVDNCNILSGFSEFQQFNKGHDNLEYVDSGHGGVQNRREKLINENITDDLLFGFDLPAETNLNFDNNDNVESYEHFNSNDYIELYHSINQSLIFILNNFIADDNLFTKSDVKQILLHLVEDDSFWNEIEYDIPEHINESFSVYDLLEGKIRRMLIIKFNELIERNIKFSKYDVKHACMQLCESPNFWSNLDKYIKDE